MAPEKRSSLVSDSTAAKERHPRTPITPKAKEAYRPLALEQLEDRAMQAGDFGDAVLTAPYEDVTEGTAAEIGTVLSAGDAGGQNAGSAAPAEGEASEPSYDDLVHLYNVQQKYGFS